MINWEGVYNLDNWKFSFPHPLLARPERRCPEKDQLAQVGEREKKATRISSKIIF